jgi:phosphoribosyl 1,2-cyclic phosphodiesterase
MKTKTKTRKPIYFDVWGSRGSRSIVPPVSRIGNRTSCYSLLHKPDLLVLDAGLGLAALTHAMSTKKRFDGVTSVHILVTHAHMDHWEGLKDADWFWRQNNGLRVTLHGSDEALRAIRSGYSHPLYVPLERLAEGKLRQLRTHTLSAGERLRLGDWLLETCALNHYSGAGRRRLFLSTLGYRLSTVGGPTVTYLSDHEPTAETRATEQRMTRDGHLVVLDAHFPDIAQHAFGHGSWEHAAAVARESPSTLVLAGHHGPAFSDAQIEASGRRHGRGLRNLDLAVEGRSYVWSATRQSFARRDA